MCKERRNRRHPLSIIIALLTVLALPPCLAKTSESPKPTIVFILADDMNRDAWGIYGSVDCKTPNIDQLASDGLRLDRAYFSVFMCAPYRQELYSGRSPWPTGTLPNHSTSKLGTKSIPHYLKPPITRLANGESFSSGPVIFNINNN